MYPCEPAGTHGHCGPQGEMDHFCSHPLEQHPRGPQGEPDSVLFAPPGPAPTRAGRARMNKNVEEVTHLLGLCLINHPNSVI